MTIHYTPDIEAQGKLFYGRNAQLDAIFGRRWVWVCGQRRMGKSSLLLREAYRSETDDGWLAFYFILHKVTGYDQADGHQFFSDFVKNVLGPRELDKHERPLDDEMQRSLRALGRDVLTTVRDSNRTPAQKFRYLVDRLQRRGQFRGIVFLWDEADGLLFFETNQKNRSPDEAGFLGEFHELFYSDDRFRLVVAGSQKFSALGNVPVPGGGNFLEPFRWMPLPGLEPGEARSLLLCENTAMWNPAILNEILDEAIRWSGGHPLILQKIGTQLAVLAGQTRCNPYQGSAVNRALIDRCFTELIDDFPTRQHFRDDFERLTVAQQAIIDRLFQDPDDTGVPADELRAVAQPLQAEKEDALWFLRRYGYVTDNSDSVSLNLPFYKFLLQRERKVNPTAKKSVVDPAEVQRIHPLLFVAGDKETVRELVEALNRHAPSEGFVVMADRETICHASAVVIAVSPGYLDSPESREELGAIAAARRASGCAITWLSAWPTSDALLRTPLSPGNPSLAELPALHDPDQPLRKLDEASRAKAVEAACRQLAGLLSRRVRRVARLIVRGEDAASGLRDFFAVGSRNGKSHGKTRFTFVFDPGDGDPFLVQDGSEVDGSALYERLMDLDPKRMAGPPSVDKVRELGRGLAELLLPSTIKNGLKRLGPGDHLEVVHDARSSLIPWETLRFDDWHGVDDVGISRRFTGKAGDRSTAGGPPSRAPELSVLLITNPTGDLNGAEREAELVHALEARPGLPLKVVTHLSRQGATREGILQALRDNQYDLLHYAGHAMFNPDNPGQGGLVCHGDVVLTGEDLRQVPTLPRFVFFNACESGRIRLRGVTPGQDLDEKAGMLGRTGIAETFLRAGVSGLLGTYWPVGDRSAQLFAQTFYSRLAQGQVIGLALHDARSALLEADLGDWANYLHYGSFNSLIKAP